MKKEIGRQRLLNDNPILLQAQHDGATYTVYQNGMIKTQTSAFVSQSIPLTNKQRENLSVSKEAWDRAFPTPRRSFKEVVYDEIDHFKWFVSELFKRKKK